MSRISVTSKGVYKGPKRTKDSIHLSEITSLVSLGAMTSVNNLYLSDCINLVDLGNLTRTYVLDLGGCKKLKTLGRLETVGGYLNIAGCKELHSIGSLKKVDHGVLISPENPIEGEIFFSKVKLIEEAPLEQLLNLLLTQEAQDTPLFKNMILRRLSHEDPY